MGSELSTPTVVGATVAAGIVGAALYAKQQPDTPEPASPSIISEKDKGKAKASVGGGRKRKGGSSVAGSTKRVVGTPERKDDTPPALAAQAALFDSGAEKGHSSAMEDVMASTTSVASKSSRRKRGRKPKAPTATVEQKEVEPEEEEEEEEDEEDEATPEPTTATSSSAFGGSSKDRRTHNKFSTLLAESQYVSAKPSMDASWLQVDKSRAASAAKRRKQQQQQKASAEVSSDAGFTASATGDDSHSERGQESNSMQALAGKLGHVQPKTQVDDMLPPEPTMSRVMRVQSAPDDDLLHSTDADAEEEGWGIVRRRRASPNTASTPVADPNPSDDELTKDQRRREARKDAAKAAKADAEAERLKQLAQHKKEQEKARMQEMRKKELSASTKKGKEAKISGGMKAVVQDGKLVWE